MSGQAYGAPPTFGDVDEDKKKAPTKFSGNLYLIGGLILAVIAVLGLSNASSTEVETTWVVQAASNINALTEIDVDRDFEAVEYPVTFADRFNDDRVYTGSTQDEALNAAREVLQGTVVRIPIYAGTPIDRRLLSVEPNISLITPVRGKDRLFSISTSLVNSSGGTLRTGDRVDIYGTAGVAGDNVATLLFTDVEIAHITQSSGFQSTDDDGDVDRDELVPGDPLPEVYTLRLDADQVAKMASLVGQVNLFLVYRDPNAETSLDPEVISAQLFDQMCPPAGSGAISFAASGQVEDGLPVACKVERAERTAAAQAVGVSGNPSRFSAPRPAPEAPRPATEADQN